MEQLRGILVPLAAAASTAIAAARIVRRTRPVGKECKANSDKLEKYKHSGRVLVTGFFDWRGLGNPPISGGCVRTQAANSFLERAILLHWVAPGQERSRSSSRSIPRRDVLRITGAVGHSAVARPEAVQRSRPYWPRSLRRNGLYCCGRRSLQPAKRCGRGGVSRRGTIPPRVKGSVVHGRGDVKTRARIGRLHGSKHGPGIQDCGQRPAKIKHVHLQRDALARARVCARGAKSPGSPQSGFFCSYSVSQRRRWMRHPPLAGAVSAVVESLVTELPIRA